MQRSEMEKPVKEQRKIDPEKMDILKVLFNDPWELEPIRKVVAFVNPEAVVAYGVGNLEIVVGIPKAAQEENGKRSAEKGEEG